MGTWTPWVLELDRKPEIHENFQATEALWRARYFWLHVDRACGLVPMGPEARPALLTASAITKIIDSRSIGRVDV